MTAREIRIAIGALAALVVVFVVEHVRDRHRDAELQQLHGAIARDSAVRIRATQHTDTVTRRADTAVTGTRRADSGWARARVSAARVPAILAAPVHDTIKIRELVEVVDTLVVRGDSLERAADADSAAIVQMTAAITGERASWKTERGDLSHALDVSEAQHRHWGLGATFGYAVIQHRGAIVGGPGASVGITYRW